MVFLTIGSNFLPMNSMKSFSYLFLNFFTPTLHYITLSAFQTVSSAFNFSLQELTLSGKRWIIGGDLNCLGGSSSTVDQGLLNIFDTFGLCQWVSNQTHVMGGLLDLVVSPEGASYLSDRISVDMIGFSDHYMVTCELILTKARSTTTETKKQRSFKRFNIDRFKDLFMKTKVVIAPANNVDEFVDQFDDAMTSVLDQVAPLRTVTCNRGKKNNVWLSDEAVRAKRDRRRHERKWCKTKTETDRTAYRKSCIE